VRFSWLVCQGNPMDQPIESFLGDVLALVDEEPDAGPRGGARGPGRLRGALPVREPHKRTGLTQRTPLVRFSLAGLPLGCLPTAKRAGGLANSWGAQDLTRLRRCNRYQAAMWRERASPQPSGFIEPCLPRAA
jgi:hypothetical protein